MEIKGYYSADHEIENPSSLSSLHRSLRLREPVPDAFDKREDQRRYLLILPSVLHRQAEVRGYGWSSGAIQQEIWWDLFVPEGWRTRRREKVNRCGSIER
jgi:hypothetical protein